MQPLAVRGPDELDNAFAIAASEKMGALLVFSHGFAVMHDRRIIEAAAKQRLPVMLHRHEKAVQTLQAGGRDALRRRGALH